MARPTPRHSGAGTTRQAVLIWLPGLAVACGAGVATAHGLYEVALAARVPAGIAWLYPLITDGLALVAYAATARLTGSAAGYAWTVVVTSASLSGLAQAAWLAADGLDAAPVLRFGVGAWPAVAAAVVAHLLHLLMDVPDRPNYAQSTPDAGTGTTRSAPAEPVSSPVSGPLSSPLSQPPSGPPFNDPSELVTDAPPGSPTRPVSHLSSSPTSSTPTASTPTAVVQRASRAKSSGPPGTLRARAISVATTYLAVHGSLPTVRILMAAAEVSRGTAAIALHELRRRATAPQVFPATDNEPREPYQDGKPAYADQSRGARNVRINGTRN